MPYGSFFNSTIWQYFFQLFVLTGLFIFYLIELLSSVAGLLISLPVSVKREPWQGQSQLCSALLYFRAQPRCGHLGVVGVKRPIIDSNVFMAS